MWPLVVRDPRSFDICAKTPLPKVTEILQSGCAICGEEEAHREICEAIRWERETLERAEAPLKAVNGPDSLDPLIIISPLMGPMESELLAAIHHCSLPYLLQRVPTVKSVYAQIDYYETMGRVISPFNPEIQFACLPLIARLSDDQVLYDTVICLCRHGELDGCVLNADVLSPINFLVQACQFSFRGQATIDLVLAMAFLKVKLLTDLIRLNEATLVLTPRLPREIVDDILNYIPRSGAVLANPTLMRSKDLSLEIAKLENQVDFLVKDVHRQNAYFWPKLVSHNADGPVIDKPGVNELTNIPLLNARRLFTHHAYHWFQTPGAVDMVRQQYFAARFHTHTSRSPF
ncbi:unnamed protein product [Penicillium pancosmium]